MIKANDLKPGDLVRVCEDNWQIKKGTICEILSIDLFHKYCSELNWVTVSNPNSYIDKVRLRCIDIEGIPLTLEILEKNKWKLHKYHKRDNYDDVSWSSYYKPEETNISLRFYLEEKAFFLFLYAQEISETPIRYVHQFQHILWALDNNVNFKI